MTLKFRKPGGTAPAAAAGDTSDSFEAGKADAAKPAG